MIKFEIVSQEVKNWVAVQCDVCGKEYKVNGDDFEVQEFFHIRHTGGFTSIFGDEDRIQLDICQYCFKELVMDKIKDSHRFIKDIGSFRNENL